MSKPGGLARGEALEGKRLQGGRPHGDPQGGRGSRRASLAGGSASTRQIAPRPVAGVSPQGAPPG
jgi:hypothetical protein